MWFALFAAALLPDARAERLWSTSATASTTFVSGLSNGGGGADEDEGAYNPALAFGLALRAA